jgi:hypothetical protein
MLSGREGNRKANSAVGQISRAVYKRQNKGVRLRSTGSRQLLAESFEPHARKSGQQEYVTDGLTNILPNARLGFRVLEELMAKLALIYGMRLLPEEDLGEVQDATVVLKNGRTARVTMHLIEGSKEEIESTVRQSIDAFFDMYPEI